MCKLEERVDVTCIVRPHVTDEVQLSIGPHEGRVLGQLPSVLGHRVGPGGHSRWRGFGLGRTAGTFSAEPDATPAIAMLVRNLRHPRERSGR